MTFVLWRHKYEVKFLTTLDIEDCLDTGRKSIRWEDAGAVVRPGTGFVFFDFLRNMRERFI